VAHIDVPKTGKAVYVTRAPYVPENGTFTPLEDERLQVIRRVVLRMHQMRVIERYKLLVAWQ
jgi:hypothetical protein